MRFESTRYVCILCFVLEKSFFEPISTVLRLFLGDYENRNRTTRNILRKNTKNIDVNARRHKVTNDSKYKRDFRERDFDCIGPRAVVN